MLHERPRERLWETFSQATRPRKGIIMSITTASIPAPIQTGPPEGCRIGAEGPNKADANPVL